MNLPTRRKRRTPEEINAVAERYWQSELTQRAFAEAEGVCVATLAKYLRVAVELRRRSAGPAQADATTLVEVRRQATGTFAGPFAGEHLRISFPNGTALEMAAPGRELGALLRELFALR
jgi:hypothetical protein